ncbi:MAG: pyrroline-5-carboxylate reductase family protein [Bacillota bacterium]|jgi:pyrroline-5-carboxylate reductase
MNIGILGFGNLGTAFATGIITKNIIAKSAVNVCDKSEERLAQAKKELGVNTYSDVNDLIRCSDILVLAVKPHIFPLIAPDIDKALLQGKTVMSFMAGTTIGEIAEALGIDCQIVRIMQNIAIKKGNSVTAITDNGFDRRDYEFIKSIFSRLGYLLEVEESEIEKVTSLSGCGLGFAAYIINSFIKAGREIGFDQETSEKIIAQTFMGALSLGDFSNTVTSVATKGGATEQGLNVLAAYDMDKIALEAVEAAYKKALSLKK